MKRSLVTGFFGGVVTLVLLAAWQWGSAAAGDPGGPAPMGDPPVKTSAFMRAKLASSQKVLEGLVVKDFDLISRGAKELRDMSDAAAWPNHHDPVYTHYSREFRRQAEKLRRLAEDHNLEGASFTYLQATTTCISCHEYVRDVIRVADKPAKTPGTIKLLHGTEDQDAPSQPSSSHR